MKKQLLLIATIFFALSNVNAQCTPTPGCTTDPTFGYCTTPADGTDLPDGTVGHHILPLFKCL